MLITVKNKDTLIKQTIDAAKQQNINKENEEDDLIDVLADIIIDADGETSGKIFIQLDTIELDKDSDFNLTIIEKLSTKDLYEEKLEIIVIRSRIVEDSIDSLISKSVKEVKDDDKLERIINVINKSEGLVSNKIINSAENDKESENKVVKIIINLIENDPEKAISILEKNKKIGKLIDIIKTKIENGEAITVDDFDNVFDENISPN